MFVAPPPSILPIFEVVNESILPMCMLLIAWEATNIAFNPFSGSIPACAFFPWKEIFIDCWAGALYAIEPIAPPESKITISLQGKLSGLKFLTPCIPASSQIVKQR